MNMILKSSKSIKFHSKIFLIFFFSLVYITDVAASSEEAKCKIKIDDLITGSSYMVEETISYTEGKTKYRKTFNIPLNKFTCFLVFYDMTTGTSLACESNKENEKFFIQSDRSGQKESPASNKISFKTGDSSISLNVFCSQNN